jgi:hypothetical protein
MNPTPEQKQQLSRVLVDSPHWLPIQWRENPCRLLCAQLSQMQYQEASFLDQRAGLQRVPQAELHWDWVSQAVHALPINCHFLFHISHAGSTLLARILGTHPNILSVREPIILRQCLGQVPAQRIPDTMRLLCRTFKPHQKVLLKPTSIVNEIAETLMHLSHESRAVLLWTRPEIFVPNLLEGSPGDLDRFTHSRHRRLMKLLSSFSVDNQLAGRLDDLSPGQAAAMNWLCEWLTLCRLQSALPNRCLFVDFDDLLDRWDQLLPQITSWFDLRGGVAEIAPSSFLSRYAKEPTVAFGPMQRRELTRQAQHAHAMESNKAIEWLLRFCDHQLPLLDSILSIRRPMD